METHLIHTPSGDLNIVDLGVNRKIFSKGKPLVGGKPRNLPDGIETPYTEATVRKFVELKGDWWLDEMLRRSDPGYVRTRLETLVGRFGTFNGKRVLDMGSGSGSSALVMCDLGATHVTGVEIIPGFVQLAQMRAADEGLSVRATFVQARDTTHLPFADGSFDIVTFNAVLEHLPPQLRVPILQEAWRCLSPKGLLVFTETPNRAFPYDGHTTWLPLLPWLPLALSYPLAKYFSRNVPRGSDRDTYISEGLIGGSYWQIVRALPDAVCLNTRGGDAKWKTRKKNTNPLIRSIFICLEWLLNRCGLPLSAIMPSLDLVFKKPTSR